MKTTLQRTMVVASLAFVIAGSAVQAAPEKPSARKAVRPSTLSSESDRKPAGAHRFNPATGTTEGRETGALTGTRIRKTYTVHGHHTDAAQPVYIIDRNDPRFTSRSTVGGVVRGLPFSSGRGR